MDANHKVKSKKWESLMCYECKEVHDIECFCAECYSCLYKNSTQVEDNTYPLFKCKKCDLLHSGIKGSSREIKRRTK